MLNIRRFFFLRFLPRIIRKRIDKEKREMKGNWWEWRRGVDSLSELFSSPNVVNVNAPRAVYLSHLFIVRLLNIFRSYLFIFLHNQFEANA